MPDEPERDGEADGEREEASAARPAPSYTPLPDREEKPKSRRPAAVVAVVLAVAMGLGALRVFAPRAPVRSAEPPQASQMRAAEVLTIAKARLDAAATTSAREALKRGETPAVLAQAGAELKRDVAEGRRDLYSIKLIDSVAEDGDVVGIFIDGQPLGMVTLSHAGAVLTVPLKSDGATSLRVLAEKDGGGGVTFGAVTSRGQTMSQNMNVGESLTWSVRTE